ncbi:hypothetical protein DN752_01375 [Echinicola strongylocentroti]|uniref:Uncharacterized protein n=1 Tax=Echinicola strongylocentroti TaxID=1795355 RepID=A0A2Z4IQ16_9BACT|nr:hypothetical protein DN752_01375 [Echinicola strongylocentroti]
MIVTVVIVHVTWRKGYDSLEKRYVVGKVDRIIPAWGQDPKVEFSFTIYGNKHSELSPRSIYHPKKGQLYIVEVPIKDIKKSKILLDFPISDPIDSPWEGWEKIPEFIIEYNQ